MSDGFVDGVADVGFTEGTSVGILLGATLGDVGPREGRTLGAVGSIDGIAEGDDDGLRVGVDEDGRLVGGELGADGCNVGLELGKGDGWLVGLKEGLNVGFAEDGFPDGFEVGVTEG